VTAAVGTIHPRVFLVPERRAPPFQNLRYAHPVVPESKRCTVVPRLEHDTLRQILCFVPSRTTVACYRFSNQSVRFCRQQHENISFLQWPNVVACRTASPLACCVVSPPHSTEAFEPLHQGLAESREGAHQNRQDRWKCPNPEFQTEHKRNENAVVNIFVEGLRILAEGRSVSACGGTARLGGELKRVPVKQETSLETSSNAA